ncbi:MAG: hypothetical protein MI865_07430 [Proteobacteria bacterium]|nr:hypothetical protein [Pseudomonadota bacterium]
MYNTKAQSYSDIDRNQIRYEFLQAAYRELFGHWPKPQQICALTQGTN